MTKHMALAGAILAVMFLGTHQAFAQTVSNEICFLGIFCIGGGGHPAPAPLLAAGVPAFTAVGGGVLVSRLYRKLRRR
jgi:hypothetical protein